MSHTNNNWKPTMDNRPRTFYERIDHMLPLGVPVTIIVAVVTIAVFYYPFLDLKTQEQAEGMFFTLFVFAIPGFLFTCQAAIGLLICAIVHIPARRQEQREWAENGYYREFMPPTGYDLSTMRVVPHKVIVKRIRAINLENA